MMGRPVKQVAAARLRASLDRRCKPRVRVGAEVSVAFCKGGSLVFDDIGAAYHHLTIRAEAERNAHANPHW